MTRPFQSHLSDAVKLLTVRLFLAQIGLLFVVFVLFLLFLRTPDASVLQVVASGFLVLLTIAATGFGQTAIMLVLAGRPRTLGRLLRGTFFLLVGIALWIAWSAWIAHLASQGPQWAALINSRLSSHLRYRFTFEHILLWLGWIMTALCWIGAGMLAAPVFVFATSLRPARVLLNCLVSFSFWLILLPGIALASCITGLLINWTPGHGLWPELISAAFRLAAATVFDTAVGLLLLAILGVCVRRADDPSIAPGTRPEDSHPLTAEAP